MSTRKPRPVLSASDSEGAMWPFLTIMGVDPSMSATGWSVVRFCPLHRPMLIAYGNVRTDPSPVNMENAVRRGREVYDGLKAVAHAYRLDAVSIELPVPSARGTGSQSGSLMVMAASLAVHEALGDTPTGYYMPNTTKKWVTGNGRSEKSEVKDAVFEWLGHSFRTNTDVTDSIAAAITHALHLMQQRDSQGELPA